MECPIFSPSVPCSLLGSKTRTCFVDLTMSRDRHSLPLSQRTVSFSSIDFEITYLLTYSWTVRTTFLFAGKFADLHFSSSSTAFDFLEVINSERSFESVTLISLVGLLYSRSGLYANIWVAPPYIEARGQCPYYLSNVEVVSGGKKITSTHHTFMCNINCIFTLVLNSSCYCCKQL